MAALRRELARFEPEILELSSQGHAKATEREVWRALAEYVRALDRALAGLMGILENLEQNEKSYRDTGVDGRSGFTRDKLAYDRDISELERLGTRLNRLFARY